MAIKQSPAKKPLPSPRKPSAPTAPKITSDAVARNAQAIYNQLLQYQMDNYLAQTGNTSGQGYGMAGQITPPPGGGLGGLTADEANIPANQRIILDTDMAKMRVAAMLNSGYGIAGKPTSPPSAGLGSKDIYNQLMQQQLANYAAMNQDAATNFGSIEPGKIYTQPAKTTTAKPQVPIAGIGMQQAASQNQQRNFSTQGYPSPKPFG